MADYNQQHSTGDVRQTARHTERLSISLGIAVHTLGHFSPMAGAKSAFPDWPTVRSSVILIDTALDVMDSGLAPGRSKHWQMPGLTSMAMAEPKRGHVGSENAPALKLLQY